MLRGLDAPNLPALMFACARARAGRPMARYHRDGAWRTLAWEDFARQAAALAAGLRARGVAAGDRVLLASENRPEVPIAETALTAIGAVPVPAYATNLPADHAHVLRDSGARLAIASGPLAARVAAGAALAGGDIRLLAMDEAAGDLAWEPLVSGPSPLDAIAAEAAAIPAERLACLIYTSGTGGAPKGVMLPHRSILANCRGALELLRPLRLDEVEGLSYLSFLPVSHSFEHTVGQVLFPAIGAEVIYGRGIEHLAADLAAQRPSLVSVVPRLLEVMRHRVLAQVARQPAWRRAIFARALAAGQRRLDGLATPLDRLLDPALDRLVRARVRARFGGRLIAAVCGGARLDPEVERFFLALGLRVVQGYGQTEAGPVISCNPFDAVRVGTVGPPLAGVELRFEADGEILVRGDLVMQGYWNNPAATADALDGCWLRTGDVGTLDAAGYLRITDRKKDLIVLAGGDNVSPARVEARLMQEPEIAQAVVSGDGEAALAALLVPSAEADAAALASALARANRDLPLSERVRRHVVVPPFTLEDGLLTPTHKIRRALALQRHAEALARLRGG